MQVSHCMVEQGGMADDHNEVLTNDMYSMGIISLQHVWYHIVPDATK